MVSLLRVWHEILILIYSFRAGVSKLGAAGVDGWVGVFLTTDVKS